jgi:hypothetical protein
LPKPTSIKLLSKGGACIFVHETLNFDIINPKDFSSDLDIEGFAVKIQPPFSKIGLLSVYRVASGNFSHFLKKTKRHFTDAIYRI